MIYITIAVKAPLTEVCHSDGSQAMTASQHGEPWRSELYPDADIHGKIGFVQDSNDGYLIVAECVGQLEQMERIVACVNALAGRNPEDVKRRLEERDELLRVCKAMAEAHEQTSFATLVLDDGAADILMAGYDAIKAAIAKAEG